MNTNPVENDPESAAQILARNSTPLQRKAKNLRKEMRAPLTDLQVTALQKTWDGCTREILEDWADSTTKWIDEIEQMRDPTNEKLFDLIGTAYMFAPAVEAETRNALMLTAAIDHGKYVIRPDRINGNITVSHQTTSTVLMHVVREKWFKKPQTVTIDFDKCAEMIDKMRHIPYLHNVMRMFDKQTKTESEIRVTRYSVTPESAMHDPRNNLAAYQVITGVVPDFSTTYSQRGQEKNVGWFLKEELMKHIQALQKNRQTGEGMIDDNLEDAFEILQDPSSFDIDKKSIWSKGDWNEMPELKEQETLLLYAQDDTTVQAVKDALEVIVTQGMSTTFGVKSEEYLIMREAVMLIHSTNTLKSELTEEEDWVVDSEFRKGLRETPIGMYHISRLATGDTHWYVPGDDNNMTQIDIEHVERAMKVSDYENAIPGLPEERAGKKPKPVAGNQELNKWVEYTIKVVLVTYEEQLRHSTMIPGERIGEGYKPVMEQSSEERWELFKELCDLHLVHRNEKSETANFEHNVQNHEPFTGNQCEHAINFQRRLLVNLTTDKASIRESMESTKRAKEGLLGLRDEEEAMLIRENRIVELTAWERNRKVSKEEMESELGKLLKWIKERTAGGVQRSSRAVGNRLNRKLAQLELVETDGIEEMCGKLGVQKIAYKGSDDTISFSWSFIMDPQAP